MISQRTKGDALVKTGVQVGVKLSDPNSTLGNVHTISTKNSQALMKAIDKQLQALGSKLSFSDKTILVNNMPENPDIPGAWNEFDAELDKILTSKGSGTITLNHEQLTSDLHELERTTQDSSSLVKSFFKTFGAANSNKTAQKGFTMSIKDNDANQIESILPVDSRKLLHASMNLDQDRKDLDQFITLLQKPENAQRLKNANEITLSKLLDDPYKDEFNINFLLKYLKTPFGDFKTLQEREISFINTILKKISDQASPLLVNIHNWDQVKQILNILGNRLPDRLTKNTQTPNDNNTLQKLAPDGCIRDRDGYIIGHKNISVFNDTYIQALLRNQPYPYTRLQALSYVFNIKNPSIAELAKAISYAKLSPKNFHPTNIYNAGFEIRSTENFNEFIESMDKEYKKLVQMLNLADIPSTNPKDIVAAQKNLLPYSTPIQKPDFLSSQTNVGGDGIYYNNTYDYSSHTGTTENPALSRSIAGEKRMDPKLKRGPGIIKQDGAPTRSASISEDPARSTSITEEDPNGFNPV